MSSFSTSQDKYVEYCDNVTGDSYDRKGFKENAQRQ